MASKQSTVDYIVEQISAAGVVSYRKMFGEYGIYCDGRMPILVCDDQFFIKPTDAGRKFIGEPEMAPPYPGARDHFLISGDNWDDAEWLTKLVKLTVAELPVIKPKKTNKSSKY